MLNSDFLALLVISVQNLSVFNSRFDEGISDLFISNVPCCMLAVYFLLFRHTWRSTGKILRVRPHHRDGNTVIVV